MQDITKYTDDELSLIVFNTEKLYCKMIECETFDMFEKHIATRFKCRTAQLEELRKDYKEDRVERLPKVY